MTGFGPLEQAPLGSSGARWAGPDGEILVEVKSTNSVRDVRDALLTLAYALRGEAATTRAVCVLTGSKLSGSRLADELRMFRAIVRPSVAPRVHVLQSAPEGAFVGSFQPAPQFSRWLHRVLGSEIPADRSPRRGQRQAVVATLVQHLLWGTGPVTLKWLQDICKVSYPTVAAALNELDALGALERSSGRGVSLRPLMIAQWMEIARGHAAKRKAVGFVDPTGLAVPAALARRLWRLQQQGKISGSVRVGGVLGASHHFAELDITAAPRLDLSFDGPAVDLVQKLDAALVAQADPRQRPVLVVHQTLAPWLLGSDRDERRRWAPELDCLADLIEQGLTREAAEMARDLTGAAKRRQGRE